MKDTVKYTLHLVRYVQNVDAFQVLQQYILDNTPSKYHDYLIPTYREFGPRFPHIDS